MLETKPEFLAKLHSSNFSYDKLADLYYYISKDYYELREAYRKLEEKERQ